MYSAIPLLLICLGAFVCEMCTSWFCYLFWVTYMYVVLNLHKQEQSLISAGCLASIQFVA